MNYVVCFWKSKTCKIRNDEKKKILNFYTCTYMNLKTAQAK